MFPCFNAFVRASACVPFVSPSDAPCKKMKVGVIPVRQEFRKGFNPLHGSARKATCGYGRSYYGDGIGCSKSLFGRHLFPRLRSDVASGCLRVPFVPLQLVDPPFNPLPTDTGSVACPSGSVTSSGRSAVLSVPTIGDTCPPCGASAHWCGESCRPARKGEANRGR